ncbi:MAG TPA: hypothetical protein VHI52_09255 [Verrucomicrobiae bacterium]|nr:hypothetical protein [Verrucomicrobiae bacterium]
MNPNSYWYMLAASLSGGLTGVLVMWNRTRAQDAAGFKGRHVAVSVVGTAACVCALWAFNRAFGTRSCAYAAMVSIVTTGWAAVIQPLLTPLVPWRLLRVRAAEFVILQARWNGVRMFGDILRRTALRSLGGRVYLYKTGDARAVLRGLREAQAVHLAGLLFSCPWLAWWGVQQWWQSIACAVAVQVPLNVYPVLHLRYVTWRVERFLAKSNLQCFCSNGRLTEAK